MRDVGTNGGRHEGIPSPGVSLNARPPTNPSAGPAFDALVVLPANEQLPKSSVKRKKRFCSARTRRRSNDKRGRGRGSGDG